MQLSQTSADDVKNNVDSDNSVDIFDVVAD